MISEQPDDATMVDEPTTSGHDNATIELSEANVDSERKQDEVEGSLLKTSHIFRQDVVKSNNSGRIGVVSEVAGDSDSDSSVTDEEDDEDNGDEEAGGNEEGDAISNEDTNGSGDRNADGNSKSGPITTDQVRVLWLDESETTQNLNDVTVVDRGFLHGDYVAASLDPTGQVGVVVDVNMSVDVLSADGSVIKDISSRDLKRVREFTVGDYVVLGPWLGRIDDVIDNVTVLFDDGSVCKVMKADPVRLKAAGKTILEDGNFPYYPGLRVKASSSSVFKNSRWLSGSWKANRLEGTVTKVAVGSVFIYWIASAGYGPDSSTAPAEEQSPKNLKLLSCFSHANWQLSDWCLLPPSVLSTTTAVDKGLSKLGLQDSANTELGCAQRRPENGSEVVTTEDINTGNESMDIDSESTLEENNDNAVNDVSRESSSCAAASKDPIHETWPLHRKKIRKVVVRRDKKARRKEEVFEKAVLIVSTKTKVDVIWQDGTTKRGLESTALIPVDNPGDHEFVAEQYVVEKTSDDSNDSCEVRRVGIVKSVNAKERIASVRWFKPVSRAEDPREFDKVEVVSVYELEGHPDYDYCYGDVVVRLSPVTVSTQIDSVGNSAEDGKQWTGPNEVKQDQDKHSGCNEVEGASVDDGCMGFADLSWVGNITGLQNGDIEVTWADGMVSMVGPQAIYVVGRDDDDESVAAGSEISDDAASWETVADDEMDDLENEIGAQSATDQNSEAEESRITGENSGRNAALSIPLAALGFVTRLATGIFARGRKNLDPSHVDSESENELQTQDVSLKVDSGDETSSHKSNSTVDSSAQVSNGKEGEHADAEDVNLMDVAEALCSLKPEAENATECGEHGTSSFKGFDIVQNPLDHNFIGETEQSNAGRKWLKKVQQDWGILQNNLPDGIYVRAYEDRMDLLRAVIVGAYGTPYQDGLFFFDFHLPLEYPDVPPSAYYHSGGWRINPNLYEEGKVCLSLLNTWTGRGNEVWDPSSSSILQVLVSLQGLVLNSKPYFNEAGYDKQIGTAEGEKNSLSYNENTFLLNCKMMMYLMRKTPKDFEDLVKGHFQRRGYYILKACDAYMKGYLIGSLTEDASVSDKSETNANSVGFKLMLGKIVPKLFIALNEVGANCDEFKHLHQS